MGTASLTQDQAFVSAGANEELAGPPYLAAPVQKQERISSIDALRGFALLGILIMNIPSFAWPRIEGSFPVQMVHPVFSGPLEWLWRSLTYWNKQPMLLKAGA